MMKCDKKLKIVNTLADTDPFSANDNWLSDKIMITFKKKNKKTMVLQ